MTENIRVANASPTKEFFVYMLVRDILLKQAILELIDNSIDGAKKIRQGKDFNGLRIEITYDRRFFQIKDNCGGIPLDVAEKYAFRFGKSPKSNDDSIETTGTYGVGMKRALFKIGQSFHVTSMTKETSFKLNVDVKEWIKKDDEWDFKLTECIDGMNNTESQTGTEIRVDDLYPEVAREMETISFRDELIKHVNARLGMNIDNGIEVTINDHLVKGNRIELVNDDRISPIKEEYMDPSGVNVKIIAGIAKKSVKTNKYLPEKAGWYIYCNERLVVAADKTSLTTWKDMENDSSGVIFTNTLAPFQGAVFFNSSDSSKLPWNTAKTGIDGSSLIYTVAREKMMSVFMIVKGFIEKMRPSSDNDDEKVQADVESVVENMNTIELSSKAVKEEIKINREMNIDTIVSISEPMARISYSRPKEEVDRVKDILNVRSNREVGNKTFEYYFDAEC